MSTATAPEIIPHHYVVVFKQSTPAAVCSSHCDWAHQQHCDRVYPSDEEAAKYAGVKHRYQLPSGFAGYAGSFDADLVRQLEATEEVRPSPCVRPSEGANERRSTSSSRTTRCTPRSS
jgi:hypothetical protein